MDVAKIIDQTFLHQEASDQEVEKVAQEAKQYGFRAFCILPQHTKIAKVCLQDSGVKVTTLIDEPTGASSHEERLAMVNKAKENGSDEIELVMKVDDFKNKKYKEVSADLKELCSLLPTKVIIGSGYLTDEEIKEASKITESAGAICVKTATVDDPLDNTELAEKAKHIKIMRESVNSILVKASGAIRNLADVEMMLSAGADIIGTSSGVKIVQESQGQEDVAEKEAWRKTE
jgi:deoxyribose-phosphate aldolase